MATLHYIHDPLCGWCYAVAPLIAASRKVDGLDLHLHGGGLMSGPARRQVTPELRAYVMGHDQRIAQLTGQVFGDGYYNGLLLQTGIWFDSTPPIAAILAAEALAQRGADMQAALQSAHYAQGLRISEADTLMTLAASLGLDQTAFAAELSKQMAGPVDQHIAASRQLLQQAGGGGFPTLLLETEKGWRRLDTSPYLGKPEAWQQALEELLSLQTQAL